MSTPVTKPKIEKDGLRYKARVPGSPFGETCNDVVLPVRQA
jgi:hypothetical protein